MERVLIVVERESQFELATELIEGLTSFSCKVHVTTSDFDETWCDRIKHKALQWKIPFIDPKDPQICKSGNKKSSLLFFFVYLISKFSGANSNFNLAAFISLEKQITEKIYHSEKTLECCDPEYLLVFEDGIGGPLELISAAKKRSIFVAVCPYEISQRKDLENLISRNRRKKTEYLPPTNLIGKYFEWSSAKWIFHDRLGQSLLLPAELILARKCTGIEPTNPWAINGGQADLIATESTKCHAIYLDNGIPANKLTIAGSAYSDKLFQLKDRNPNRVRSKTLVLISLPPNFDNDFDNNCCGSYFKMLQMLKSQIERHPNLDALISIHPATLDRDRKDILSFDWKISNKPILEDLHQSQICISVFSSTIRWFLASSVPVINLDVWNFGLELYNKSTGFLNCKDEASFTKNLSELASQKNLVQLRKEMSKVAGEWGTIDGKATSRLLETLRSRNEKLKR